MHTAKQQVRREGILHIDSIMYPVVCLSYGDHLETRFSTLNVA